MKYSIQLELPKVVPNQRGITRRLQKISNSAYPHYQVEEYYSLIQSRDMGLTCSEHDARIQKELDNNYRKWKAIWKK